MSRRLAIGLVGATLITVAVAIVLVAGGGEDDEKVIGEALREAATSRDPSYCTEVVTVAYLEQRTGLQGEDAVLDCEARAPETLGLPESVELIDVEIEGETAIATTLTTGGDLDGARSTVALVNDDGWRLDRLEDIEGLDRDSFVAGYTDDLAQPPYNLDPAARECVADGVYGDTDAEFEDALIDVDAVGTVEALVKCDRDAVVRIMAVGASAVDPGTVTDDCIRTAAPQLSDAQLVDLYLEPGNLDPVLKICGISD